MAEQDNEKSKYDYQEFAKQLAMQAEGLVPVDLAEEQKRLIINYVYRFCCMASDPLAKDNAFSLQDTLIIIQLVGEWTFHKSIDLIRAGIIDQARDAVLQAVAFVVFEIARQAISKKMDQQEVISVIEHHVKKKYLETLTELKTKGIITEQDFDTAMGQSNIDTMDIPAEENAESQEQQVEMPEEFPTNKVLKLASFAMVLQKMPKEKINSVLSKLPPREANLVKEYIAMDDLSAQASTLLKYVNEIHKKMPKTEIKGDKLQYKLSKIVTKKNELKIDDIISKERELVKKYIASIKEKRPIQLSTPISNIIYEHLLEKVKA